MKKLKNVILAVILVASGYFLAVAIEWTHQEPLIFGSIGKVNRYNKQVVSADTQAFEARLKSDEEFRELLNFSLSFINVRTGEFQANAEIAVEATSAIPELEEVSATMAKLAAMAANANEASTQALESLELIVQESAEANIVNYETLSNNAFLSYLLIDRSKKASQEFVEAVDSYISKNKSSNKMLAFARDLWVGYGVSDALYNNDKELMKVWKAKGYLIDEEISESFLTQITPEQLEKILSGLQLTTAVAEENVEVMADVNRVKFISAMKNTQVGVKLKDKIQLMAKGTESFKMVRAKNRNSIDNIVQEGMKLCGMRARF
ncbi:MAG: hypothetical protein ACRC8J_00525 [Phocaeicola sp.]